MRLCKALSKPGILWMANSLTNDNSFTIHSFHWLMCPINNVSFVYAICWALRTQNE